MFCVYMYECYIALYNMRDPRVCVCVCVLVWVHVRVRVLNFIFSLETSSRSLPRTCASRIDAQTVGDVDILEAWWHVSTMRKFSKRLLSHEPSSRDATSRVATLCVPIGFAAFAWQRHRKVSLAPLAHTCVFAPTHFEEVMEARHRISSLRSSQHRHLSPHKP